MGADSEPWHMKIRIAHGLSILLHVYRFQAITWGGLDQNTGCCSKPQKRVTGSIPNCLFLWPKQHFQHSGYFSMTFSEWYLYVPRKKRAFWEQKRVFLPSWRVSKSRNQALFSAQLFDSQVDKTAHTQSLLSLDWDCWTTTAFQGQRCQQVQTPLSSAANCFTLRPTQHQQWHSKTCCCRELSAPLPAPVPNAGSTQQSVPWDMAEPARPSATHSCPTEKLPELQTMYGNNYTHCWSVQSALFNLAGVAKWWAHLYEPHGKEFTTCLLREHAKLCNLFQCILPPRMTELILNSSWKKGSDPHHLPNAN